MDSVTPGEDLEPPRKRFRLGKVRMPLSIASSIAKLNCTALSQLTGANEIAKSFICTVEGCSRCYSRADTLRLHMKQAHGRDVTQKKSRFLCPVSECAKSFFHATQLMKHLKEHKMDVGK